MPAPRTRGGGREPSRRIVDWLRLARFCSLAGGQSSTMKLRWISAGLALLVVAGGAFYYFSAVPGRLADDYAEDARPVHDKVAFRLRRVFATFEARTFTTPPRYERALERADTADQFLRAL